MNKEDFNILINGIAHDDLTILNYWEKEEYHQYLNKIYDDVRDFRNYTFDGRFEEILFDSLKEVSSTNFEQEYSTLLKKIESKLDELVVPNIILIPLNHLNEMVLNKDIYIDDRIVIFANKDSRSKIMRDKTDFSRYVESKIYATLNGQHILNVKDHNFFNYPTLALTVNNIDYKAEHEAFKVAEAVYSFIRMIDFPEEREPGNGWGFLYRDKKQSARTYSVYYNDVGTSKEPPFNNGYGHSFRFRFSPILDINTAKFLDNITEFRDLINDFLDVSYGPIKNEKRKMMKKWQNAVMLFNVAYEFASIERIDSSVSTLLTILEMLFLKNNGGSKKKQLIEKVPSYFSELNIEHENIEVEEVIKATYSIRNSFIHEGEGYDRFLSFRSINDHQGMVSGMKPFAYNFMPSLPMKDLKDVTQLFEIVVLVLRTYSSIWREDNE